MLTTDHQALIEHSSRAVKQFMDRSVAPELNHFENLNLIIPEKAQVIKNFVIKQDLVTDIKVAEESSLKIDLSAAKQKLIELEDA